MVHYLKNPRGGRPIALDYKTGKIKEEHESWYNSQKPPEAEPPEKWQPPIPGYEHPPKYLVPKGGGFYGDPNEPADPQDCDGPLGEISPWCGGNPFSIKPLDLDPEIKFDECNIWARVNPVVGFVKIRPITLAYRLPGECRNEPPKPPPPPPPQPGQVIVNYPRDIDPNAIVYAFVSHSGTYFPKNEESAQSYSSKWSSYRCPGLPETHNDIVYYPPVTGFANFYGESVSAGLFTPNKGVSNPPRGIYRAYGMTADGQTAYEDRYHSSGFDRTYYLAQTPTIARIGQYILTFMYFDIGVPTFYIYEGRYGSIIDFFHAGTIGEDRTLIINVDFVVLQTCGSARAKTKEKLPPPPKEPKKDCCMNCSQQNDLLRQILAEARKAKEEAAQAKEEATQAKEDAAKAKEEAKKAKEEAEKANEKIGSNLFPATLAEGLSSTKTGTKQINNLAEFMKQQVVYLDEIIGEVPVKIKIQDSDLLKEGDQPVELVFDNVLELQTEQFGITMNNSMNTELIVQLNTKILIELGVLRKQLHTLQSAHNALVQYIGHDVRESFEEVPFTFTVPKTDKLNEFSMEDFIKPSTQKVEISKLEKKEIGAHKKFMLLLQKTAGIIHAVFWKKLAKGGIDLVNQMKSMFNKQHQTINDMDKHQDDLEDWLEEYERGFTATEGYQGDPAKPWGTDYEARPRTKIVGKLNADVKPPTD